MLTLNNWKLYLNSCATYHSTSMDENGHKVKIALNGHYSVGVSSTNNNDYWGPRKFWYDHSGIANPLYILQLDKAGYKVETHVSEGWVVISPGGKKFVFKRDTCPADHMPYIGMCDQREGFATL